jgi:hypothetical protein
MNSYGRINWENILITVVVGFFGLIIGTIEKRPTFEIPTIPILPTAWIIAAIIVAAVLMSMYLITMMVGMCGCCGRMA